MSTGMIDVDKTRVFAANPLTVMQVSITVGLLLAGLLLIVLSRGGSDGAQAFFLGSLLIFGALARIGYTFYLRSNPNKPIIELSSDGILYRLRRDSELRIPWNEVRGLDRIDLRLSGQVAKLRDVTVASVSQDFFNANVPVESWWAAGRGRKDNFIRKGDAVQIALRHDLMPVPAEELWNEVEARWRVFSGQPNAVDRAADASAAFLPPSKA